MKDVEKPDEGWGKDEGREKEVRMKNEERRVKGGPGENRMNKRK